MAQEHLMAQLGGWAGYDVVCAQQDSRSGQSWWVLTLQAVPGWLRQCSQCGKSTRAVHDYSERRVRDLPLFQHRVELIVPRLRVACDDCGPKLERLSWLEPYVRVTRRLGDSVAKLCKVASIRHVAEFFGLDWKTVKALDFASLQRELGPVDLDGLEVIGMDEFAIQKGHRYATVIVEPTRKRVLWVGRGRGRADVRPFFEMLGPQRCRRLRAAVMDMNAGYEIEVKHHCPQAAIVFDLFHVVAKYGREVIDRVRVDCANALRGDKPARRVVQGCPLAAAEEPRQPRSRARHPAQGTPGGQPIPVRCARSTRRAQGPVELPPSGLRRACLEKLVLQGQAQPHRATQTLRRQPQALPARDPGALSLSPRHQPHRGH